MPVSMQDYLSQYDGETVEKCISKVLDMSNSVGTVQEAFLSKDLAEFKTDVFLDRIIIMVGSAFSQSVDTCEYRIIDDQGNELILIDTEILKITGISVVYEIHRNFKAGQRIFLTATNTRPFGTLTCKLMLG